MGLADRPALRRFAADQRGSLIIWLAFGLMMIIGLASIAVDMSFLYVTQTRLQGAADAAALAAASALPDEDAARALAVEYAEKNMPAEEFGTVLATSDVVPGSWDNTTRTFVAGGTPANAVRIVTRRADENGNAPSLFFANVLGVAQANVSTVAIAGNARPPTCVLALDPGGAGALGLDSNASIDAPSCNVQVNSSDMAALTTNNNAAIQAAQICVVGDYSQLGASSLTPEPSPGCEALDDPLAGLAAPVFGACDATAAVYDSVTDTLDPGVYCDGLQIIGSADISFNPGIYVIRDAPFIVDGSASVQGDGVGFYLTGGATLSFASGTQVDLKAPASGELSGVLFFQDRDDSGINLIDSDNASRLEGTLYFPGGILQSHSNGTIASGSAYTVLIAWQLDLSSSTVVELNTDYAASSVPLPAGLDGSGIALLQ